MIYKPDKQLIFSVGKMKMPVAIDGMKECTKCGEVKPVSEYYKASKETDGLKHACIVCLSALERARRDKKRVLRNQQLADGTFVYPITKTCTLCKETKPAKDYNKHRGTSSGLATQCRACMNAPARFRKQQVANGTFLYPKTKRCSLCKETKTYTEFSKSVGQTDGLCSSCKVCSNPLHEEARQALTNSKIKFQQLKEIGNNPSWSNNGFIQVPCFYNKCRRLHEPKASAIEHRIKRANQGDNYDAANLYCSDQCKHDCKVFRFRPTIQIDPDSDLYVFNYDPRELQGPWAKAVKKRDNHQCTGCANPNNLPLHAHHDSPLATTYDAWLLENGSTLCTECHALLHSTKGCTTADIARAKQMACAV